MPLLFSYLLLFGCFGTDTIQFLMWNERLSTHFSGKSWLGVMSSVSVNHHIVASMINIYLNSVTKWETFFLSVLFFLWKTLTIHKNTCARKHFSAMALRKVDFLMLALGGANEALWSIDFHHSIATFNISFWPYYS